MATGAMGTRGEGEREERTMEHPHIALAGVDRVTAGRARQAARGQRSRATQRGRRVRLALARGFVALAARIAPAEVRPGGTPRPLPSPLA